MKKLTIFLGIFLILIALGIGIFIPASWKENIIQQIPNSTNTGSIACWDETDFTCTGTGEIEIVVEEPVLSNSWTLTTTEISEIKSNGFMIGSWDAPILWIEYSDLQCPYCKDLHNAKTSQKIMQEQFAGDVDYIWKHYPKAFHKEALPAQQMLECIAEQKWPEAFYEAIDIVFTREGTVTLQLMENIVLSLWADETKVKECLESWKYRKTIFSHIWEAVGIFDAKYVPSTIIINTQNGKRISYVGDESYERVIPELEKLK